MKRVLLLLGTLLALLLGVVAGILGYAHWRVRSVRPPLPAIAAITTAVDGGDRPQRLSYVNTATQKMPRNSVLSSSDDPNPEAAYLMSHPSFVLEWRDGRILLVDAGMSREGALQFGRPIETLGADPIQPLTSTADTLRDACGRVTAVVFTHLHIDHVGGIEELCRCAGRKVKVFVTPAQARVTNYTTSGARSLLDQAPCVELVELPGDGPLWSLPELGGVAIAHAGGHTPGSQVVFASTNGGDRYAFTGDLVNHIDGVRHNVPKPSYYSLLIVPEDREQLEHWRQLLQQLSNQGYQPVVAHDQLAIEALGIPKLR
ncbi:MAG TPA: MBL fold metallo-hydrolase [Terriglobales bacterium]|nr:MBL fold metallo-hydrolase [Terriglobales bacterium]